MKEFQVISCNKDQMVKSIDNNPVTTVRYHCASKYHYPLCWNVRVTVRRTAEKDFKTPDCPWCKQPMTRGGPPDDPQLVLKGHVS